MTKHKVNKKTTKFWGVRGFLIANILLSIIIVIISFKLNKYVFAVMLPVMIAVIVLSVRKYIYIHNEVYRFMIDVGERLKLKNLETLFDSTMPIMAISDKREIIWYNEAARVALNNADYYGHSFDEISTLTVDQIRKNQDDVVVINKKVYTIHLTVSEKNNAKANFLYFVDVTQLYEIKKEYEESRPVVMAIMLDSYEEIIKNTKESEKTRILSEINRLLEEYIGTTTGFIKSLGRDRYMAVVEKRHYDAMVKNRFAILDDTKNIATNERVPMTLSIGVSTFGASLEKGEQQARQALEMALGRGGDQVAVKTDDGFKFFGGVSKGIEKRTKVKSRILASAMADLIENSDNIIIMGHRFADLDALGSAIGIHTACRWFNKPAKIVIDADKCLAKPLMEHIKKHDDSDIFVSPSEGMSLVKKDTLLFIVDTHSPHFVESPEICAACKNKVVIDHHRRMVESINNAVILYHEPYASSASEMVAELIQYFGENLVPTHYQAEALLAGIVLDTKNFIMKTGVRTFEAAAYLKRMGADTVEVRKLFSNTMDAYRDKNKLVTETEVYRRCAIVCSDIHSADIRLIAPQAADELLWVNGVDAAFVLYEQKGEVNVSSRSMGKINVQVIMEKIGGGGHQTMAGAQVKGSTCQKVREILVRYIDEYYDNLGE